MTMMKTIIMITLLMVFFPALPGHAITIVYDSDNNVKYSIDDEGLIYNNQGKVRARIVENKVYDTILNFFWFRIAGDKIYNKKDEVIYQVVGYQIFDKEGNFKGYIKGKSFAESKWNIAPLQ